MKTSLTESINKLLIQPGTVRLLALFGGLNVALGMVVTMNGEWKMALLSLVVGISTIGVAFYGHYLRTASPLRYFRPVTANFAAMLKR